MTKALIVVLALSISSCVPAKKIWDTAYDTCVAAMRAKPIVEQVAQKKGIPVVKYAEFLCNTVEVLDPFVDDLARSKARKADKPADIRAVEAAQLNGLL